MRIAERFYLADISMKNEYIRRHNEIWPEMKELIKKAGIRNYTIWLSDGDIFAYYEVEDLNKCREVLRDSEVKAKWDQYMSDIITFKNNSGVPDLLDCAFMLE